MALTLNTNIASLNAQRNLGTSESVLSKALQRLSSGLRINSAADDAAGLAISERMTTQIRGLSQAVRNANDGISFLQTAEGALGSVTESLQRIRELAVQAANSTNSVSDRAALQQEIAQLTQKIGRVGRTTTFNGQLIFAQTEDSVVGDSAQLAVLDGLRSGWLTAAEDLIREQFGIEASGQSIRIELTSFTDGKGGTLARVTASIGTTGTGSNITLQIDMSDFVPANPPNGGSAPVFNDRILAHEMTHAIMFATMNVGHMASNHQEFFLEGVAELIHGGDERLYSDLAGLGGGNPAAGIDDVMAMVDDWAVSWDGSSEAYSAAYAGMRYLDAEIRAAGGAGIRDIMTYLAADPTRTLDQALANASSGRFASVAAFKAGDRWAAQSTRIHDRQSDDQCRVALGKPLAHPGCGLCSRNCGAHARPDPAAGGHRDGRAGEHDAAARTEPLALRLGDRLRATACRLRGDRRKFRPSGLGEHVRGAARDREIALSTVQLFVRVAACDHLEHAFDALQAGRNQYAIAFVQVAAASGTFSAIGNTRLQAVGRIAPFEKLLQTETIGRQIVHAAERTTFIFDANELGDTGLTRFAGAVERVDVVGEQVLVFFVEQPFQTGECLRFFGDEFGKMFATDRRIHGSTPQSPGSARRDGRGDPDQMPSSRSMRSSLSAMRSASIS